MKIPKNVTKHIWTIIIVPALGGILYSVASVIGLDIEPSRVQTPEQPTNGVTNSATGVEGGIHIHNNIPQSSSNIQSETQSEQQNGLNSETNIPRRKKEVVSQKNIQVIGDDNTNSSQINGNDNKVDFSNKRSEIEEQTNIERNTNTGEGSQYFENAGSDNTFCSGNDDTACSNDGTINNNPAQ